MPTQSLTLPSIPARSPSKTKILAYARQAEFRGRSRNNFRLARKRVHAALARSTDDRRSLPRDRRRLWTARVNAAARQHGIPYSRFAGALRRDGVALDRRALAELATLEPLSFRALAQRALEVERAEAAEAAELAKVADPSTSSSEPPPSPPHETGTPAARRRRAADALREAVLSAPTRLGPAERAFLRRIAEGGEGGG